MPTSSINPYSNNAKFKNQVNSHSGIATNTNFFKRQFEHQDTFHKSTGTPSSIKFQGKEDVDNILDNFDLGNPISPLISSPNKSDSKREPTTDVEFSLETAAGKGQLETVRSLISKYEFPVKSLIYPLCQAVSDGQVEVVNFLIVNNANVNPEYGRFHIGSSKTLLGLAAKRGHVEVVKALIDAGANVNLNQKQRHSKSYYRPPLTYAAERGHVEVVKALIDANAEINYRDFQGTPLYHAAKWGHVEVVKALIDANAEIDSGASSEFFENEDTPLYTAAVYKNLETVEVLIAAGANVNSLSKLRNTPLSALVHTGD